MQIVKVVFFLYIHTHVRIDNLQYPTYVNEIYQWTTDQEKKSLTCDIIFTGIFIKKQMIRFDKTIWKVY